MKLGISTACFYNRLMVEDALQKIKDLGVKTTECFFATMSEYRAPLIDKIASAANGLDVHSAHAMNTQFEPQLFSQHPRQLADATEIFDGFLSAAQKVGARNYTFHGILQLKRKPNYQYDYDRLSAAMNDACDRAAQKDVRICYENVHYSYASNPDYLAQMLARCPKLGAVLDVKQAVQAQKTYRDYLSVMQNRLETVHLCDMRGFQTCLPGTGEIDFVQLFADLRELHFDGAVLLEVYPSDYGDYDELMRAYDFLQKCLEKSE